MEYPKRTKKGSFSRSSVVLLCLCVPILCLFFLFGLNLPEVSRDDNLASELGELGKLMVAMLPDDLAFTVFAPSEEAFKRFVNLQADESLGEGKMNNTLAILSCLMGFSAIPRRLWSEDVPIMKERSFDSVSGYRLHVWRARDGALVVNNVRSERVDLRLGEIVVHVMGGVIMDPELAQSFQADDAD